VRPMADAPLFQLGIGGITSEKACGWVMCAVLLCSVQMRATPAKCCSSDPVTVAVYSSNISVLLLGKGDETFQPVLNFSVRQSPIAVESVAAFIADGDLNGET
jgi:hypothetical protein